MKVLWIVIFCAFSFAKSENHTHGTKDDRRRYAYADLLMDSLESQHWAEDEEPCLNTMLKILDNVKNSTLWSVWILDSLQLPIGHLYGQKYHLSHYDECLKPNRGFLLHPEVPKTQYCVVNVTLTETEKNANPVDYVWPNHNDTTDTYLKKPSKYGLVFSSMAWGVCVPKVCQPPSTAKIARSILQISHFGAQSDSAGIRTTHCETADELTKLPSTGPTLFKISILLLVVTAIFCTYYVRSGKASSGTFGDKLAHSFSLDRNMKSVTKINENEFYCINFMRIITCFAVVCIHYFMFVCTFMTNGLDLEQVYDENGYVTVHLEIVVDTFLVLSGLLYTRGLLSDRWQNPLKFIWKRYVRLAAGLSAGIFFLAVTSHKMNSGPTWHVNIDNEQQVCADHWLINLLMLSNVFHAEKMCNIITWYISCDYQLCVYATILFIIYKKNKKLGQIAFATAFVFSILIPGIMTYVNNYPALIFHGVMSMVEPRYNVVFNSVYIRSYCRAGPFLAGIAMGYIVFKYKPKDYRKVIGKLSSYLAIAISMALFYAVFAFGYDYYKINEPIRNAIYVALNRTVWGIAVCIIIGVSEYGEVPLLNKIFTWYPLVPLSRLTYGVYITHYIILYFLFFSIRTTYKLDLPVMYLEATGVAVYSFIASLLLWLLVEAPLININNMLLDHTWTNGTTKSEEKLCNGQKSNGIFSNGKNSNGSDCNVKKFNELVHNGKNSTETISNGKEKVL